VGVQSWVRLLLTLARVRWASVRGKWRGGGLHIDPQPLPVTMVKGLHAKGIFASVMTNCSPSSHCAWLYAPLRRGTGITHKVPHARIRSGHPVREGCLILVTRVGNAQKSDWRYKSGSENPGDTIAKQGPRYAGTRSGCRAHDPFLVILVTLLLPPGRDARSFLLAKPQKRLA
jgi:hypothetical protein